LKCIQCTRFRRKRAQQLMGQLPKERVTPSRPFLNSGIDYAGPFSLKTWRGRNARTYKSYIALFVCLSTSAIHLELVTEYTAKAFIAAYKRFSGRRGICSTLWSDCGTNFKGAEVLPCNNCLRKLRRNHNILLPYWRRTARSGGSTLRQLLISGVNGRRELNP